jgi:hypothetical protein
MNTVSGVLRSSAEADYGFDDFFHPIGKILAVKFSCFTDDLVKAHAELHR